MHFCNYYMLGVSSGSHLSEEVGEVLLVLSLAYTLATTALRGLDHHREADLLGGHERLVHITHAAFGVDVFRHGNWFVWRDVVFVTINHQT